MDNPYAQQELLVFTQLRRHCIILLVFTLFAAGCSSNQSVKNVWKSTKGAWYTYVNKPIYIDYKDKGDIKAHEKILSAHMLGVDLELTQLERVMTNADRPPTDEWVGKLFERFPWLDGFVGISAQGEIIGMAPGLPIKPLDLGALLTHDEKQKSRLMRGSIQDTPMGPEVFLTTPIFNGQEFMGVVSAYFDIRSIVHKSANPEELIILSPQAILWGGKYDIEATSLASTDWPALIALHSKGTISDGAGTFYWIVRHMGMQPLIFVAPVAGAFPEKANATSGPTSGRDYSDMPLPPVLPLASFPKAEPDPEPEVQQRPQPTQERRVRRVPVPMPAMDAPSPQQDEEPMPQLVVPSPFGPRRGATGATGTTEGEQAPKTEQAPAKEDNTEPPPRLVRPSPFGPQGAPATPANPTQ